ncbi:MAG: efflux RND transporter permease subunit [Chloroflexi bacterium]|nr:efflux RND transporter permease subunit [Chloroflexota bacterium]
MWHLTKLALRNRLVTLGIVAVLAGVSIWAIFGLQMELIPDIEFPYATVVASYPEAPPDEVASQVSSPIENVIWERWNGKGLKHVSSTSANSISFIAAEFEFGTSMDEVTETIRQDISGLTLPPEVLYRVEPINLTTMMPLVTFSLSGDIPPDQLKEIADSQIVPKLSAIKGVLSVETQGGEKEQIIIAPDPEKMNQYGISVLQIISYLQRQPEYASLADIENTSLGTDNVVLRQIAGVGQGPAPMAVVTRTDGQPSLTINVVKDDTSNTVTVANAVVAEADKIGKDLGSELKLTTVSDQSDFIESSVSSLVEKALVGGALAIVVVFLFLMAVQASLVTAISIPLSMLFGFLAMRLFDITINILTLSAMSIAVGRLIDDSIVMVEVIYRRLQQGEGFREAAIGGAKEVATPITAATLATVAIFLPLMFVGGIVGQMFIPFALTVTFAMLASLLVALMVVPTLSKFLVSGKAKARARETRYERVYTRLLKWALGHRALTLIIAAVLFVGSLGLLPLIGTSFMSGMSEKMLIVDIQMRPGTDIGVTSGIAAQVEALLDGNKEIKNYYTTVGTSVSLTGAFSAASGGGDNTASINVYLDPKADMDKEAGALRLAIQGIPGGEGIAVSTGSGGGAEMGFSGVDISIQGKDQDAIARVSGELYTQLQGVAGVANLENQLTRVVGKLDIKPNDTKLAALGLSDAQEQQLEDERDLLMKGGGRSVPGVQANINGASHAVFIKGVEIGIVGEAETLRIGWPSVALADVADVTLLQRPTHIGHTDLSLSATISGAVTAKDVGAVNQAVQEKIDNLSPHDGVEVKMGGVAEEMSNTFSRMGIAIIAAIFISFLVVVIMMRSVLNPLIIMVSLPLASIGALLGLVISGYTLGVSGMMGMLMLIGIVLTNAIVLIAVVEQLRHGGMSSYDALIQGGQTRLRPILMTALTTIFAMVPLALGVGSGTIIAAELAVVVIGGLFSSTLLTLVVIPVLYSLTDRFRRQPASKSDSAA